MKGAGAIRGWLGTSSRSPGLLAQQWGVDAEASPRKLDACATKFVSLPRPRETTSTGVLTQQRGAKSRPLPPQKRISPSHAGGVSRGGLAPAAPCPTHRPGWSSASGGRLRPARQRPPPRRGCRVVPIDTRPTRDPGTKGSRDRPGDAEAEEVEAIAGPGAGAARCAAAPTNAFTQAAPENPVGAHWR